jgi:hypothetical protein
MDGVVDVDVDGDGTGARTVRDQRGDRGAVDWTLHSRMAGGWVSLVRVFVCTCANRDMT